MTLELYHTSGTDDRNLGLQIGENDLTYFNRNGEMNFVMFARLRRIFIDIETAPAAKVRTRF